MPTAGPVPALANEEDALGSGGRTRRCFRIRRASDFHPRLHPRMLQPVLARRGRFQAGQRAPATAPQNAPVPCLGGNLP